MSLFLQMRFNGTDLATGTGFLVQSAKGPVLVTNRHNFTGRHPETGKTLSLTGGIPNEVVIAHNQRQRLGSWALAVEPLLDENEAPLWWEHPTFGARADFVALQLQNLEQAEIIPYDPANPGPPIAVGPAEVVSVVGFPFGKTSGEGFVAIWATGYIASEPDLSYDHLPVFLIDCRGRPGQSGSPVIAYRGGGSVHLEDGSAAIFPGPMHRFLGIYSGRINDESDLGMVWKASAIAELIALI
ncbi:MAG: serine protease [Hyphomonadaceae bacterium]|jgi:hypothetical protein|nr:serine protease [Hyphomonadaceae bacterium]